MEINYDFNSNIFITNEIIKNIKHSLCYVANDYEQQMREFDSLQEQEKSFQLPDGNHF